MFRLKVAVSQLEASLLYEDSRSSPLALAHIEAVRFDLHVHPATMRLTASLGNLRAQDGQLPEVPLCSLPVFGHFRWNKEGQKNKSKAKHIADTCVESSWLHDVAMQCLFPCRGTLSGTCAI